MQKAERNFPMATPATVRERTTSRKLKNLAEELSAEIGRRAERLPAKDRVEKHKKLLAIANRSKK